MISTEYVFSELQSLICSLNNSLSILQQVVMTIAILPYAVEHYNFLLELRVTKDQFESGRASKILFSEIERAFLKHHVEHILSVILLHNHFLLNLDEMLVNVDSVAIPWDARSGSRELTDVNVSAWRFIEKSIASYEFAHAAAGMHLDDRQMQAFFVELDVILEKWNLVNVLGICSLGETPINRSATMEFTSERANITLPFDMAPNDGNVVDVMWQFSFDSLRPSIHAGSTSQGKQDIRCCTWYGSFSRTNRSILRSEEWNTARDLRTVQESLQGKIARSKAYLKYLRTIAISQNDRS